MRRVQSLFKTMLMLIPMTAVPVMALFGIPQFFPVSASPFTSHDDTAGPGRVQERRVGQSDALQIREFSTEPAASFDLFQPYDARSRTEHSDTAGVVANASSNELVRRRLAWTDPLSSRQNASSADRRGTVGIDARRDPGTQTATAARVRSHDSALNSRPEFVFNGQAAIPPRNTAGLNKSTPNPTSGEPDATGGETTATRSISQNARLSQADSISWSQAVDRLNELGIRTFRLTPDSERTGYRFVCLVTSVDDPRISRRFEAESADPLVAVGRVLAQVENWNLYQ
jgi:hypothetical protein